MSIRINGVDKPSTLNTKTTQPMNTYHLAANPNLYEIQRKNNFDFVVTDIDGIVGTTGVSYQNAQEILRISVSQSAVPHFSQNIIELKRGNNTLKYAGTPEFGDTSFVFRDFIGAPAKEVLLAWQSKSYNTTTQKVGLVEDYKKDCYLCEYSPDYQLVRKWKMHGCWISELTEGDYNADDNEKQEITAKITYDWAELDAS